METILLTLSPFVVSGIVALIKKVSYIQFSDYAKVVLRLLVAVLSLLSVVVTGLITGSDIDLVSIQAFAEALLTFLGATGVYLLTKKR